MGHISKAILVLTSCLALTLGQALNVLIVCDDGNIQAENGIETAIKYLDRNNMANINQNSMVFSTGEPFKTAGDFCSQLDSMIDSGSPPDVVLDLSSAGDSSEVVKSLTRSLGLPSVATTMGETGDIKEWAGLTEEQQKYLVQVRSPSDMFQYVINDLSTIANINDVAILYDESFKLTRHYKHLLLNMPVRHTLAMLEVDTEKLAQQLLGLVSMDVSNFYILASPDNIQKALTTANEKNLVGGGYSWVVATKSGDYQFDASCCAEMNVVTLQPQNPKGSALLGTMKGFGLYAEPLIDSAFYADLAAKTLAAVAKMKKDGSWPEMTYTKCSQFGGGQPVERSLDLMSALKVSGVADVWGEVHLSTNGESHMDFHLKVHLHETMDYSSEGQNVGTWTTGFPSAFNLNADMEDKLVLRKTRDVLRVVSVIQPPFMEWNEEKGSYEGYAYDLMEEIKKILGIEYELYITPDGKYGTYDEKTGIFDGLAGQIQDRKADIGLGAISVLAEREAVLDYTVPFYDPVGISILMQKTKVDKDFFKFFKVLQNVVWGTIIGAYFLTSSLLWVFDRFSPFSYQNNIEKFEDDDETRFFTLKESLWFGFTSLTPQGGGEVPKGMSGKMVAATWWLFGFIIVASYTANLAAFLTVSRLAVDVNSLDDLMAQSKIGYAAVNSSRADDWVLSMTYVEAVYYEHWKNMSIDGDISEYERSKLAVWDYPVSDKWTRLYENMKGTVFPMDFEEAVNRVLGNTGEVDEEGEEKEPENTFALLADSTDVRYQALINCDLRRVGDDLGPKPYALAVPKGSPLREQLNQAILTLSNQRKLEGLKEKWWNQNENRKICEEEDTGAIGIENMGGIFMVIFIGLFLSLVTLGVEYFYYKFKAKPSDIVETKKVAEIE